VTFARQPDGERTVVLRPRDAALALRRLEEWNRAKDEEAEATAKALWVAALKEQPWSFEGFLDETTKRVLGHDAKDRGAFLPGDWTTGERAFEGWRARASVLAPDV